MVRRALAHAAKFAAEFPVRPRSDAISVIPAPRSVHEHPSTTMKEAFQDGPRFF